MNTFSVTVVFLRIHFVQHIKVLGGRRSVVVQPPRTFLGLVHLPAFISHSFALPKANDVTTVSRIKNLPYYHLLHSGHRPAHLQDTALFVCRYTRALRTPNANSQYSPTDAQPQLTRWWYLIRVRARRIA
jgi:hypothetical protein